MAVLARCSTPIKNSQREATAEETTCKEDVFIIIPLRRLKGWGHLEGDLGVYRICSSLPSRGMKTGSAGMVLGLRRGRLR